MHLTRLALSDFRNIEHATLEPAVTGTTVITGANGSGKTSVLEAVAYLATLQSFRGAPRESLVRRGTERSFLRAETVVEERINSIEAELPTEGRPRTFVNRQPARRRADLVDVLRTTAFSPADIEVVRGGPSHRRRFLDDSLALIEPKAARSIDDVERILRQRTALLRTAGRRLSPDVEATLDVWDARLDEAGTALVEARERLVMALAPLVEAEYGRLAGRRDRIGLDYERSWTGGLSAALAASRRTDVERGVSLVGPHRDDLSVALDGLPSRIQSSQGEQRSLALALRLAAHRLASERLGSPPVLLLDDVFSELDPSRARSLLAGLPPGQTLITTALPVSADLAVASVVVIEDGNLVEPPEAGR